MNTRLTKKYIEAEKLQRQIQALQEKLQGVDDEAEELEKTELHKIFKTTNITFEEYTQIVKGFLNDEFTGNLNKENKKKYYNGAIEREDKNNE